jgi:glycosyltransferase involved in cell wall biosynthesis
MDDMSDHILEDSMQALVTVDHHFVRTPDGRVWVQNIHDRLFWKRYLSVYKTITVICRLREGFDKDVEGYVLSDCEGVRFVGLPDFRGPQELYKVYFNIRKIIHNVISSEKFGCAICRLPSTIGFMVYQQARKARKRTAIEVVADPADVYRSKINPIMFFIRTMSIIKLKKACRSADGVSYVTEFALQRRYPAKNYQTFYSSIDLEDWFFAPPDSHDWHAKEKIVIHVSNIHNDGKGHDVLLNAIKLILDKKYSVKCIIVGEGRAKSEYMELAKTLGIENSVIFTGLVSNKEHLRSLLAQSHIFAFPTKAEGLPRVLIEAMACSLPCLSTPVNGIPELLGPEYLLGQQDVQGYADKIIQFLENPMMLAEAADQNYVKAKEYRVDELEKRRTALYQYIKQLAESDMK